MNCLAILVELLSFSTCIFWRSLKVDLLMYIIEVTICTVQSLVNFVCVSDNWN